MTKKLIIALLAIVVLSVGVAQAQIDELDDPGVLPDSPFYFLKNWSEGISTFFTFNDLAKAERFLDFSEKRLAEANALVEKGELELGQKAIERYQEQLNQALTKAQEAQAKGLDADEVMAKVSEATLKHQGVLAEVYEKVPEEAHSGIEQAMDAGLRGHEEAIRAISQEKLREVMEGIDAKKFEVGQIIEQARERGVDIPFREEIERTGPINEQFIDSVPGNDSEFEPGNNKRELPEQTEGVERRAP